MLLVEDELQLARLLVRLLDALGADAVHAISGAEALLHAAEPFDLVLLDLTLPDVDGHSVRRSLHDAGLSARYVLVSGGLTPDDERAAVSSGFDAALPKPVGPEDLRRQLELCRHRSAP